jgi:hypothetical protein
MSRIAEMIIVLNHYRRTLLPEANPLSDRTPCPECSPTIAFLSIYHASESA